MFEKFANVHDIFALNPITKNSVEIFELPLYDVVKRISDDVDLSFLCKGIKISNFYKNPEKVVDFAKSHRYTDSFILTRSAPVMRTHSFITGNVQKILQNVFKKYLDREFEPAEMFPLGHTMFSFISSKIQPILKDIYPHCDGFPNDTGMFSWALHKPKEFDLPFPTLVYLTDSPGQGTGFFRYKHEYMWGQVSPNMYFSGFVGPEKIEHLEQIYSIENEYNALVGYYGVIPHTALFPTYQEGYGRMIQHLNFVDVETGDPHT